MTSRLWERCTGPQIALTIRMLHMSQLRINCTVLSARGQIQIIAASLPYIWCHAWTCPATRGIMIDDHLCVAQPSS